MSFLTPALAIAGALAAALPVIIHLLFRRRRAPVEWAAMRFLLEAYRKQRRRMRFEQWLLLLVRCLILLVLGFALARPFIAGRAIAAAGGADRTVAIIIDNGLASNVRLPDGSTALEAHVESAGAIIDALDPGDRVAIIAAARPARILIDPPTGDHASARRVLESIEPSAAATDIPAALDRLSDLAESTEGSNDQLASFLLSEFRAGSADLQQTLGRSGRARGAAANGDDNRGGRPAAFVASSPAELSIPNVQVAAVEPVRRFIAPGAADPAGQVRVRLVRTGADLPAGSSIVTLRMGEGVTRPEPRTVQWEAGQSAASAEFFINLPSGLEADLPLTASIDQDALALDDERHALLAVRNAVRALLLDRRRFGLDARIDQLDAGAWLRRALAPRAGERDGETAGVRIVEIEPAALEMRDLRGSDVVLLPRPDLLDDDGWADLARFVRAGGLLLITPPAELNVHPWTDAVRDNLGVSWRIAREVEEADDLAAVDDAPSGAAGWGLAADQPSAGLLRLLAPELGALAAPVRVMKRLPVEVEQPSDIVLRFADDRPFMVAAAPDAAPSANSGASPESDAETQESTDDGAAASPSRGLVIYLAAAPVLDWTNLPSKPLIVPLVQETVREGLSATRATEPALVGERPILALPDGAAALRTPNGERIPLASASRPDQPLPQPGVYAALDEVGRELSPFVVNVPAPAGDTATQPATSVEAWLRRSAPWSFLDEAADEGLAAALARPDDRAPLAATLLIILAALLLLESLLARRFSRGHEILAGDGAGSASAMKVIRPTIDEPAGGGGFARAQESAARAEARQTAAAAPSASDSSTEGGRA